jgi:hypothetical protein
VNAAVIDGKALRLDSSLLGEAIGSVRVQNHRRVVQCCCRCFLGRLLRRRMKLRASGSGRSSDRRRLFT